MSSSREDSLICEDSDCVICLFPISEKCRKYFNKKNWEICEKSVSLKSLLQPCDHQNFHYCCLKTWIKKSRSCPLCREPIQIVHHNFSEDGTCMGFRPPPPRLLSISRASFIVTDIENPLVKRIEVYMGKRFFTKAHTELFPSQKVMPHYFATSFEAQSKALQFAERDLEAITMINPNNRGLYTALNIAKFSEPILDLILKMLKKMDLREEFDQMVGILYNHLGRYCTYSFLEELRVWMESPYDELEQWDRNAKYFVINGLPLLFGTDAEFPVLIQETSSPNIDTMPSASPPRAPDIHSI